jgi:hypothetical protein
MTLLDEQVAALEPVRADLLRHAAREAGAALTRARQEAAAMIAAASGDAEAAVAAAAQDGAAQALPVAAAELSRSRRAVRSAALGRETRMRDELAWRIRQAVCALRDDPDYPQFRDRLAELARRTAGPDAVVSEHPDGGVIARAGGVVADCSLPRLADRAVAALGTRIAGLCRT